jgi:chromosomal replication initiation ATPase DnaA
MEYMEAIAKDRARASFAMSAAAYALGVPLADIKELRRGPTRAALARQVAMYLAHVGLEMSLARVAAAFGRDRSTVGHACHLIEDRRDEAPFDALIDALEESMRAAPEPAAPVAMILED